MGDTTPKNYVYCMDHDTGFAPNVKFGICTLTGCKQRSESGKNNIEENAEPGSWVIGIGGKGTHKPGKLIYAMKIEKNLSIKEFKKKYPGKYKETMRMAKIVKGDSGNNILISRIFYYFGNNAEDLPESLEHIIYQGRNCKCIPREDAMALDKHLSKTYRYGIHGVPNNPPNHGHMCPGICKRTSIVKRS